MEFFDFLRSKPAYKDRKFTLSRLNTRREFIVEPFRQELKGARVLDLAAHDGRWSYALADTDPQFVHGIEGRQALVDQFDSYPDDHRKELVRLEQGEVFEVLERMIAKSRNFDVIACFGFFYHITDHYRLLTMMHRLKPKLIIIDGEFMLAKAPIVTFGRERPDNELNTLERVPDQEMVMVGTPSRRWMWSAAETLGYDLEWIDWKKLPVDQRHGVRDYYRQGPKRRGTVALRPKQTP